MKTIRNWRASQSGGAITIKGYDQRGNRVRLYKVREIKHVGGFLGLFGKTVAFDAQGNRAGILA